MTRSLRINLACLVLCFAVLCGGCGVNNTAQEPDSTPPTPAGTPVPAESSTPPPPPPTIPGS